jgi:hypothetical protein
MALGLERRDQLAEARSIGPEAMCKNDAWFGHGSLRWLRDEGGVSEDKDFVRSACAMQV